MRFVLNRFVPTSRVTMKSAMKKQATPKESATAGSRKPGRPKGPENNDKTSGPVGVKVPPKLRRWFNGKLKWDSTLAQSFRDYQSAFRNRGPPEIADKFDGLDAGVQAKQEFCSKLSIIDDIRDLRVVQSDEVGTTKKEKLSEG